MQKIAILYFFLASSQLFAQSVKKQSCLASYLNQSSCQVSFVSSSIGMPPHILNGRFQPGFEFGLNHPIRKGKTNSIQYSLLAGYFAQQSLQRAAYIKLGLSKNVRIYKSFKIKMGIQNSFMLVRQTNDEFTYIGNGNYQTNSRSRLQLMPSVRISPQCKLYTYKKYFVHGFLAYEFGMQLPFSNLSSLLPIQQVHIGLLFSK